MTSNLIKNISAFLNSYVVALIPLVFLWLHNWTDTFFPEVFFIGSLLFAFTGILFLGAKLIIRPKDSARLEILISTILFFSLYFGYICSYESDWFKFLHAQGLISLRILLPIWILLATLTIRKILSLKQESLNNINFLKRIFTTVFTLLLLGNFLSINLKTTSLKTHIQSDNSTCQKTILDQTDLMDNVFKQKPNVYYIILDAYPRQDTLKELYEYNNTPFLTQLEELGFTVCKKSCSNYQTTSQSIPSTLSMDYLPYDKKTNTATDYSVTQFFQGNPVFTCFKENGYTLLNISGRDFFTAHHHKAINLTCRSIRPTIFVTAFINKTILGPFWSKFFDNHWGKSLINQLHTLYKAFDYPSPKFVFAHIMSPHDPYYLNAEGELRGFNNHDNETPKGHLESVCGISKKITSFIKSILENEPFSIIILQSDHGSDIVHFNHYRDFNTPLTSPLIKERTGILNAFYFPPSLKPKNIPQDITSVNTFRFVLSILSKKIPLLKEKVFFYYLNKGWGGNKIYIFTPEEINNSDFIK